MVQKVLRTGILGLLAVSMVGCSSMAPTQPTSATAPSQPTGVQAPDETAPIVEIPMEAKAQDLIPAETMGSYDAQQVSIYGGRRYRFRRIIIRSIPYYVPYYYPTNYYYNYWTPYYTTYDPYWYYSRAYAYPYFGSRFVSIRIRRHRR